MQSTARRQELPLDKMCLQCDVTKKNKEEFTYVNLIVVCLELLVNESNDSADIKYMAATLKTY